MTAEMPIDTHRWNVKRDGDDLLICEGHHEKHEGCTFVRYVSASTHTRAMEALREAREALEEIASLGDSGASEILERTGSYSAFDEPASVRTARAALSRIDALTPGCSTEPPRIEFHQQDWIPGFAAFNPDATTPPPQSRAFCVLNLGSILATVATGHVEKAEVPYFVAESMMHEIMHALEQWAGVEFSEERVDALLDKYRASIADDAALTPGCVNPSDTLSSGEEAS